MDISSLIHGECSTCGYVIEGSTELDPETVEELKVAAAKAAEASPSPSPTPNLQMEKDKQIKNKLDSIFGFLKKDEMEYIDE